MPQHQGTSKKCHPEVRGDRVREQNEETAKDTAEPYLQRLSQHNQTVEKCHHYWLRARDDYALGYERAAAASDL